MVPKVRSLFPLAGISCFALLITVGQGSLRAQEAEKYSLRYKLKPGTSMVSKVVHFAETRTTMADHEEASSSRTTSEKVWEIESVSPEGDATFVYRIQSVNMAQSVGDAKEISYNSSTDTEVPNVFEPVAKTLNKPLATITINPRGQVVKREGELKNHQMGIGDLTIPLPETEVTIDGRWSVPRDLRVKLDNGRFKTIKVRELYTLLKVSAGVATISIETQPLTPVGDPAVEAQLIQQLSRGQIKFDIDAGVMLSKKLDWSDEVVGFRGADTSLRYDAKFTEELISQSTKTASLKPLSTK